MRWRTTAAEETQWTVSGGRATTALTSRQKSTINKCAVAKADNNNGWQKAGTVVELEEQLFGGQQWLKRRGGQ